MSLQQSNTQDLLLMFSYVRNTTHTGSLDTCLGVHVIHALINARYSYFVPIFYAWDTR
nr:MAG TPA: hypothetical protein [Caudoviricetes sp.]